MSAVLIRKWMDNGEDFSAGIALLEKLGGSSVVLDMCRKHCNSFTRDKLFGALQDLLRQAEEALAAAAPVPQKHPAAAKTPPAVAPDFFSLPEVLQRKEREKGQLWKECLALRKQLKSLFEPELKRLITGPGTLTVAEVTELMKQCDRHGRPHPFSISFVTYNRNLDTGGELLYYEHATLAFTNAAGSKHYTQDEFERLKIAKDPRHWANSTRNIQPLASREYKKIHIWLIMTFNGVEVSMGSTA